MPEAPGVLRMEELMRPPAAVSAMLTDSLRSLRRVVIWWRMSRSSGGGKSGVELGEDIVAVWWDAECETVRVLLV